MVERGLGTRAELEERLRFETLIADLSSRFVNVRADALDREIEDTQRRVCECLDLDLSALWQSTRESPDVYTLTHVHNPAAPTTPDPRAHAAARGGVVGAVDPVAEEPQQALDLVVASASPGLDVGASCADVTGGGTAISRGWSTPASS